VRPSPAAVAQRPEQLTLRGPAEAGSGREP